MTNDLPARFRDETAIDDILCPLCGGGGYIYEDVRHVLDRGTIWEHSCVERVRTPCDCLSEPKTASPDCASRDGAGSVE